MKKKEDPTNADVVFPERLYVSAAIDDDSHEQEYTAKAELHEDLVCDFENAEVVAIYRLEKRVILRKKVVIEGEHK
jgi:hypothetical protein